MDTEATNEHISYTDAVSRIDKTNHLVEVWAKFLLVLATLVVLTGAYAIAVSSVNLHDEVNTIKTRQALYHQQTQASQQTLICQDKVFNEILSQLPSYFHGNEPGAAITRVHC